MWFQQRTTLFLGASRPGRSSRSNDIFDVQSVNLAELRGQLKLSLDEVCGKNMEIFESKLAFHTQQLQDAIARSAQFVVRTLSGPMIGSCTRYAASLLVFISFTDCALSGSTRIMEGNGEFRGRAKGLII
jgi:hypothetical protein